MFKLGDLERWIPVGKTALKFQTEQPRKVRLEVLAEDRTNLFVSIEGNKATHFIGGFDGFDVVEFQVPGMFTLTAAGGPCKVWAAEMDTVAVEIPEAVSFTTIATRQSRNPELEKMMHIVQMNMERRLKQVENDVTLKLSEERRAEIAEVKREAARRLAEAKAERDAERLASEQDAGEAEPAQA